MKTKQRKVSKFLEKSLEKITKMQNEEKKIDEGHMTLITEFEEEQKQIQVKIQHKKDE